MGLASWPALPALARTVTGTGSALPAAGLGNVAKGRLAVTLSITAASGTLPTLAASVQWSANGTTFYDANPADTLPVQTGVGGVVQVFDIKAAFYRIAYTIGGTTPSFTFSASALTY